MAIAAALCLSCLAMFNANDVAAQKTYNNPVIKSSTPDPTVIRANDGYFYLYGTEDMSNMPIYRSRNLVDWTFVGTAFTDATRPKCVQTLTTLPHFISWVIMFSLMSSLFGSSGLVNALMQKFGAEMTVNILTTDKHVWLIQALLYTWKNLGWNAIIYFAAITGLDQEVNEAAMIDGANRWQRIRYITIPLLMPTFFVLLIMSIGNFLNSGIDQFLAFSNALNKEYIEVLDLYVYNLGIGSGQISFSVAVGVMKSIIALILFGLANTASKKIRGTSVF